MKAENAPATPPPPPRANGGQSAASPEHAAATPSQKPQRRGADTFSCFSQAFLGWNFAVIRRAWGHVLQEHDVPDLRSRFRSRRVGERACELWAAEVERARDAGGGARPQLWRVAVRLARKQIMLGGALSIANGVLSTACRPLVLRAVIQRITAADLGTVLTPRCRSCSPLAQPSSSKGGQAYWGATFSWKTAVRRTWSERRSWCSTR